MTEHSAKNMVSVSAALSAHQETFDPVSVVCGEHGSFESFGTLYVIGSVRREVWTKCPSCTSEERDQEREKRELMAKERSDANVFQLLSQTAIPPRFVGKTFSNYRVESDKQAKALAVCKEYAQSFDSCLNTGASLILSGMPGTGKSHLAAAILQAILPKHVGAYVTLMDLIRSLRDTWRRDSTTTESQLLNRLTHLPLLVIDEIGVQYGTDGERAILFDVLDRRYREMKPSILMTNLAKDDFRTAIGDRVFDRMTEVGRWVPFDWPSYRIQARKEVKNA
ncbi:ATP-binding protein [Polynucleobacter sp. UK-Kesae-W10]|uniref:ATP-binding protein n=1 Tax=Polynucleobacter sp. UK-Kesae-W10 TaxID=1819738 RepID=UPI001C0B72C0|nr:ATP-binding protein [Polynucleobacter sp. UK-Kesae-W10]MBU3577517.1 ATP-binding protein [Polynucleobacter sp. UK-Kesae-W10]